MLTVQLYNKRCLSKRTLKIRRYKLESSAYKPSEESGIKVSFKLDVCVRAQPPPPHLRAFMRCTVGLLLREGEREIET
jgi:hypothetical protein